MKYRRKERGKYTYNKVLAQMGCDNYNEWEKILSNIKYS